MSQYTSDEIDQIEKEQGGKGLRSILEAALAENRALSNENASLKAAPVIEENGLTLVKPEDLAGVGSDELLEKAKELQAEREAEQRQAIEAVLAQRGLEGEELTKAVDEFIGAEAPANDPGSEWDGVRQTTGLSGETVNPNRVDGQDILGQDWHRIAEAEAIRKG